MSNLTVSHHRRNLFLSLLMFLGLIILNSVLSQPVLAEGNKCGVNVGPYYEQVQQVKGLTKEGGWIVMLGSLGQCADYGKVFGQGLNVVLRAYNGGQKFNNAQADAWVATLGALDTKGQKVYFMPWNEPNHPNEGGGDKAGAETYAYVAYLKDQLGRAGLLDSKVILLSPMVNKTNGNYEGFFNIPGGKDAYYKLTSGSSINEYDFPPNFPTTVYPQACQQSNAYMNNCQYSQVVPSAGNGYYSLEAGVAGTDPSYPRYKDQEIRTMLNGSWGGWSDDGAFNMFAIFSYDPHRPGDWNIYSAPQTSSFYKSTCQVGTVEEGASVNQTNLNSWMSLKQNTLVQCASGCGYAPKDRPELCDAAGRSDAFDLSIYDDYDADPEAFYIHPIKGLEVPYDERDVTTIRNDMINQGYEAHCATPQFKIKLNQEGEQWMATYLRQENEGTNSPPIFADGTVFGGDLIYKNATDRSTEDLPYRSILTVDYRNTLIPVFRDVTGKRWLTTSLEEYFGFSDTKIGDRSLAEINSAPINSLLSRTNRCIQALTILTKQEEMCQKIQDGDINCALYPRPIPETSYTVKTLLEEYKTQFGISAERFDLVAIDENNNQISLTYNQSEGISKFCQGMVSQKGLLTDFMTAVNNIPLNIDRAYRLAFLVTEIEMLYPSTRNMFNLFEHPNAGFLHGVKNPQDATLVNAFKIPDFGTNKGDSTRVAKTPDTVAGNVFWPDTAWLTRNSLMTTPDQEDYEATVSAKRQELITTANDFDYERSDVEKARDEIYCLIGSKNTGVGAPECLDPLSKATIDIVNATARLSQEAVGNSERAQELRQMGFDQFQPECRELDKEPATNILDPATLQPVTHESKIYTPELGAAILDKLFKDSTHEIAERGSEKDPSFAETWRDREPFSTIARMYGPEDDPTNEITNPWTGLLDWGLKSVFHVVTETAANEFPYTCCDMRKVKHFLVYPVGYDLQTVQTVLAGSFFTTDELIGLAEAAEEYDRIQVSGDITNFEGVTKTKTFQDWSLGEPNWIGENRMIGKNESHSVPEIENCTPVYDHRIVGENEYGDPIWEDVLIGYNLPCTREFGWEVTTDGETRSAGILGGKLGFYLREIQKVLNTKASDARQYIDTCLTTEQFLRGQCGSGEGPLPTPSPDCQDNACAQPTPRPTFPPPKCDEPGAIVWNNESTIPDSSPYDSPSLDQINLVTITGTIYLRDPVTWGEETLVRNVCRAASSACGAAGVSVWPYITIWFNGQEHKFKWDYERLDQSPLVMEGKIIGKIGINLQIPRGSEFQIDANGLGCFGNSSSSRTSALTNQCLEGIVWAQVSNEQKTKTYCGVTDECDYPRPDDVGLHDSGTYWASQNGRPMEWRSCGSLPTWP